MRCPAETLRTLFLDAALLTIAVTLHAQRPTFDQQMRDNQRRLETIRRQRSAVEEELARDRKSVV